MQKSRDIEIKKYIKTGIQGYRDPEMQQMRQLARDTAEELAAVGDADMAALLAGELDAHAPEPVVAR